MIALSLMQPWASLVALKHKRIETRSWTTIYRGPLAIHASKGMPLWAKEVCEDETERGLLPPDSLPLGAIVAVCRLADVRRTEIVEPTLSENERRLGNYEPGRFAWFLEDVDALPEPIPAKGSLGLWSWRR